MAKLTLVLGESHTGKSSYLYDRLEEHIRRGEHAILLVPEQATFRAETALCARTGGLLGVEVYSFERLCQRLIEQYGDALLTLSEQGRCMVLRRFAFQKRAELNIFSRTSQLRGFAAAMDAHIGRFKQSCIRPDDLAAAAERLPKDSLLAQKLSDFSLLYRESETFLAQRYLTANDLMTVAEPLIDGSWIESCHVYVDDFDRPREQAIRLLLKLLHRAESVTVTLRQSDDDALSSLFEPDRKTYERLREVCSRDAIPFIERRLRQNSRSADPALLHLTENLFSDAPRPYAFAADAIEVLAARDRVTEVALAADRILELVRAGKRFSDIALVASDLAAYGPLVRRAFARRNIPLFYDATRPISGLAPTDFVLRAARCVCLGFSMNDILPLVKSGYAGVEDDDIELFENYVLRYGIFGSELRHPFSVGEVPPEAEAARKTLWTTLGPLREAIASKKASDKVRALWEYLKANRLREQLEAQAQALLGCGNEADAQLHAQVWSTIRTLLVQLYTVMGDCELTQREFVLLLEEGLEGFSIGVLPGQGDCVTLGDLVRTRLAPVDTLFVLGCNEGLFPPARTDDDLINDAELEQMRALGLPVWGGTLSETSADRLALYTLFSKAKTSIRFSYAFSAGTQELVRAPLLDTVFSLFPHVSEESGFDRVPLPMSESVGFSMLAEWLGAFFRDGYCAPLLPALAAYYADSPAYAEKTAELLFGTAAASSPAPFGKQVAEQLYGRQTPMSASRLEQFARCPFAQYVRYGLRAEERKLADEKASDAGTFLHDALDAFVKAVQAGAYDFSSITDEQIDRVLDAVLPSVIASHNDKIFERNARLRESLFLRRRLLSVCARSIVRQLKTGRFTVAATELTFGKDGDETGVLLPLSDGRKVRLYGKIDRVDRAEAEQLLRIIDYKMGQDHKFDPSRLLSGESLQLPLYYLAAASLGGTCAGLYYMPLSFSPPEPGKEPEHKLYGLTDSDEIAICAAEPDLADKSTLFAQVKRNKDGTLTGAVCSSRRMREIIDMAVSVAAKQAEGILSGNADLYPTAAACKWCPYHSVCRFDPQSGGKTRYVKKVSQRELLEGEEVSVWP